VKKTKKKLKKRKTKRQLPVSAAVLKKMAAEGMDFPAADAKIRSRIPLATSLKRHPRLKKAWERGRLLFNIGQQAESGATIAEAEDALGLAGGELERLLAEDTEAADLWRQKRLECLREIRGILKTQAKEGKVSAINNFIKILRNELSSRTCIDFHHVSTTQFESELGVSRMNLSNWVNKQGLAKNSDGTIDLKVFIEWLSDYAVAKAARGAGGTNIDPLRTKRAQKLELDLRKQRGQLLERDAVMAGLLARHQTMLAAHQRKTEELARLCLNQPFEKSKEIIAAGFAEIRREMCNTPEQLRLPDEAVEKFTELLDGLKSEEPESR